MAEWIRLAEQKAEEKPAQVAQVSSKGGRGKKGGLSAASRELGIDRDAARRAVKVASLSDEAKNAAREAGLDDNRSALLKAAAFHTLSKSRKSHLRGAGEEVVECGSMPGLAHAR